MKKYFLLLAVICTLSFSMVSCSSKDDDSTETVTFSQKDLLGVWRITHVDLTKEGSMVDVTSNEMEQMFPPTFAAFKADGTYLGEGALGDGKGTYKINGTSVICYYEGKEFARYKVLKLNGKTCHLKVTLAYPIAGRKTYQIICEKQ